ncbi:hypothetical protein HMPREF1870_00553 [Bacteroidales bacterium KA00344]|nr:hypothetical protein HMPREF1870_00553 [Bacteroidales bacterium KA00344]
MKLPSWRDNALSASTIIQGDVSVMARRLCISALLFGSFPFPCCLLI